LSRVKKRPMPKTPIDRVGAANAVKFATVTSCKSRAAEHRAKYFGKSLDCKVPNIFLGRFLNMVNPAMNVVYVTVPNHVPNDRTCTVAARRAGRYDLDK